MKKANTTITNELLHAYLVESICLQDAKDALFVKKNAFKREINKLICSIMTHIKDGLEFGFILERDILLYIKLLADHEIDPHPLQDIDCLALPSLSRNALKGHQHIYKSVQILLSVIEDLRQDLATLETTSIISIDISRPTTYLWMSFTFDVLVHVKAKLTCSSSWHELYSTSLMQMMFTQELNNLYPHFEKLHKDSIAINFLSRIGDSELNQKLQLWLESKGLANGKTIV